MKLLVPIIVGALLAGVLDLAYAYTHFMVLLHREPMGIVQGIASGLLGGKAARRQGGKAARRQGGERRRGWHSDAGRGPRIRADLDHGCGLYHPLAVDD